MKTYLVGGAVRDKILGLAVKDRDWVVVGTTPENMIDLKYTPIGKDFPVFLHPKTHEEGRNCRVGVTGVTNEAPSSGTTSESPRRCPVPWYMGD